MGEGIFVGENSLIRHGRARQQRLEVRQTPPTRSRTHLHSLMASAFTHQRPVEAVGIMTRAMDPEVSDAIWAAVKPLVP